MVTRTQENAERIDALSALPEDHDIVFFMTFMSLILLLKEQLKLHSCASSKILY